MYRAIIALFIGCGSPSPWTPPKGTIQSTPAQEVGATEVLPGTVIIGLSNAPFNGVLGRIIEVDRAGEIVWEYINPDFVGPEDSDDKPALITWMFKGKRNWMYRAQPIPYDWVPEGTPRSDGAAV